MYLQIKKEILSFHITKNYLCFKRQPERNKINLGEMFDDVRGKRIDRGIF